MIGKLTGRIEYRAEDHLLLDVRGVGYLVYCSERTLMALPGNGEAASLYTELVVREDLLQLFGFLSIVEKEWHRLLMSVQGIGAKASMAILGNLGAEGVGRAIALGDWNAVKAAKGVGPKIAQRIVNELRDKAPNVMAMTPAPFAPLSDMQDDIEVVEVPNAPTRTKTPETRHAQADAMSALANLGYPPSEAAAAVAQAMEEDTSADTASLIRAALKLLAPRG